MKYRLAQRKPTPTTRLWSVGDTGRVWHELETPDGQILKFDTIAKARAHARLRYGPTEQQLKKEAKR